MAIRYETGGGSTPDPAAAALAALGQAEAGSAFKTGPAGGPTIKPGTPLIPVKMPGTPYNPSGAGSVNAFEYGQKTVAGKSVDLPPDQAANAIYGWSNEDIKAFAKKVWYLGGISTPQDIQGALQVWDAAVQQAARFAAAGRPMDPQDVMQMMLAGDPGAQKNLTQRKNGGVVTQKARSINLSNPTEAKALITQAFQQSMGRDPTDAEVRTLTESLNAEQRKNPTVTTQRSTYSDTGQLTGQQSTSSGGMDAGQYVLDSAQADPEAASYQAGTTYFNALMGALGPGA